MWTRLFYLNTQEAFKRTFKDGKFFNRAISGRYQNLLKKQFRIFNVPWTFTPLPDEAKNPRHKKPKGNKVIKQNQVDLKRNERIQKIMTNLKNVDNEILKYRQDRLNKKKLSGYDFIIKQTAPSWINVKNQKQQEDRTSSWNQKK